MQRLRSVLRCTRGDGRVARRKRHASRAHAAARESVRRRERTGVVAPHALPGRVLDTATALSVVESVGSARGL